MFNQTIGKNKSGESGIRTHGRTCGPTRDFQSRSFGRSDISPESVKRNAKQCHRFVPQKTRNEAIFLFKGRLRGEALAVTFI